MPFSFFFTFSKVKYIKCLTLLIRHRSSTNSTNIHRLTVCIDKPRINRYIDIELL